MSTSTPTFSSKYFDFVKVSEQLHKNSLVYSCLTPQERRLLGSTKKEYGDKPYTPFLIQEKGLGMLEKARAVRKEIRFTTAYATNFGISPSDTDQGLVLCSLEPLDDTGQTIRDPQIVDTRGKPMKSFEKDEDFPYRRDK